MKYLLIFAADEAAFAEPGSAAAEEEMQRFVTLTEELEAAGALLGGEELKSVTTATTVRIRAGETLVTDGPFADTKEAIGGYFVIEVETLDEAIAWARKVPVAEYGAIEIRPVQEWE